MGTGHNPADGPYHRIRNMAPIRCNEWERRQKKQAEASEALLAAIWATGRGHGEQTGV